MSLGRANRTEGFRSISLGAGHPVQIVRGMQDMSTPDLRPAQRHWIGAMLRAGSDTANVEPVLRSVTTRAPRFSASWLRRRQPTSVRFTRPARMTGRAAACSSVAARVTESGDATEQSAGVSVSTTGSGTSRSSLPPGRQRQGRRGRTGGRSPCNLPRPCEGFDCRLYRERLIVPLNERPYQCCLV